MALGRRRRRWSLGVEINSCLRWSVEVTIASCTRSLVVRSRWWEGGPVTLLPGYPATTRKSGGSERKVLVVERDRRK